MFYIYIYILYSTSSDKYYIGYTDDIARRMHEHNSISEDSYTSRHRPWELKGSFKVGEERGRAMKVERFIKKQKSRAYIERLLAQGNIDYLLKRFE